MRRWRLLEKKRNKNGKFRPSNLKIYLKGGKVYKYYTGGIVMPYGSGSQVTI